MLAALVSAFLSGGLDREIGVDFPDTPFSEAVECLGRESGVPVAFEETPKEILETPITFGAKRISIREALGWVTDLACCGFEAKGGRIVISPLWAHIPARVTFKSHDVRDLTRTHPPSQAPEYVALQLERNLNPSAPAVSFALEESSSAIDAGCLAELVRARIRPHTWAPELCTSIEERSRRLVVMHTPEVQAEVERFLDELRREAMCMIAVHVEEMTAPEASVRKAVEESGSHFLTRAAADGLRRRSEPDRSASVLCFNGQRASSWDESMTKILQDIDFSEGAYRPVVGVLCTGLSVSVMPYLSGGGGAVVLDLRVSSCREPEIVSFEPFQGLAPGKAGDVTVVPGAVELPRTKVVRLSTAFELPLDRTALFSAGDGTRVFLVSAEGIRP